MSFAVAAALAVGLLVLAPLAAHLLRRGRTQEVEFPPASLVPAMPATSRQRSRLEDRALFAVRSAMVLALAVLGATPLLRCEQLSLSRQAGASVALAVVLDDSLSMRAKLEDGNSRWDAAQKGAAELLSSARDGDAVAIVLAGAPARLALTATTDLAAARRVLGELGPSDRSTDLASAVSLARSALRGLPHVDKQLTVFSDFAGERIVAGAPPVWAPLASLTEARLNCGIARAEDQSRRIAVVVGCNAADAADGRSIEVLKESNSQGDDGKVLGRLPLKRRAGEQTVVVEVEGSEPMKVRLSGSDALERDDEAPVATQPGQLIVGVVADVVAASPKTGGATLVEQAISALGADVASRPLPVPPDDAKGLEGLAAVVLEDPPGLSPEARAALRSFLGGGGVALALLGPRSAAAQLGSTLEPFVRGGVRWEEAPGIEVDPASLPWLGLEARSMTGVARSRTRLDGADPPGAVVAGRWSDGAPWIFEQSLGRGLALTVGLPVSVEHSDFGLRPAFIALLDRVIREARQRSGSRQTPVGQSWSFSGAERVVVKGPEGPVDVSRASVGSGECAPGTLGCAGPALSATPTLRGRYSVRIDDEEQARVVTLDVAEIMSMPQPAAGGAAGAATGVTESRVDASRHVALVVLALFAVELALRMLGRRLPRGIRRGTPAVPAESDPARRAA
jgi:hypothetical protein